jgi:mRNA interferase RelE/StbE
MFEVRFDGKVIGFLNGLPKEIRGRVFDKILSTKGDPLRYFERLAGRPDYKLRVGDYRVVADIDRARRLIKITLIGHRKDVYDVSD